MPLYEYECQQCGRRNEVLQKMGDAPLTTCESCGGALRKLFSSPAVQFKGSGWYVTDYARKGGGGKSSGKEGGEGGGSSDSGGESKAESKPDSKGSGASGSSGTSGSSSGGSSGTGGGSTGGSGGGSGGKAD